MTTIGSNGDRSVTQGDLTRRKFIKSTAGVLGAGAALELLPALWNGAAAAETIKLGFISPLTGGLGAFGECNPYVVDLVNSSLAKGVTIGGKPYAIEILVRDSQSDPARAGRLANELIMSNGVDLMLSCSASETVNPVADACEAAGVPSLSTTVPWEAFYFGRGAKPGQPSPFKWTYHFSFGVAQYTQCYASKWDGAVKTNRKVGVLYPNDGDGNAIRASLAPALANAGFTIVDPGAYEDGTTDYSAQIREFKQADVEIINTFPIPADFATFWRQAAQQGLTKRIKIVETGKTGLFASQIEAFGALGPKLSTVTPWHPSFPYNSRITGLTSRQLADGYEQTTGRQWTLQIGQTVALFDAAVAALEASANPKHKGDLAAAISKLKVTTTMGPLDWTRGPVANCVTTPVIGMQWIRTPPGSKFKYDAIVVDNADDPNVPLAAKLLPYNA